MAFKFEQLEVWQLSLDYIDLMYEIAAKLPKSEDFNLKSQLQRAATSISLNVAEGSTGQSDAEQSRFLGMAIRSLIETIACQRIIARRNYLHNDPILENADASARKLSIKLQAFRKSLKTQKISEDQSSYIIENESQEI
jgi:four helix bundle protein